MEFVDSINKKNLDRSITIADVRTFLNDFRENKHRLKKCSILNLEPVTDKTVRYYFALIASSGRLKTTDTVQDKTDARFTAENSIFSTICFMMTLATTHFIIDSSFGQVMVDRFYINDRSTDSID